MGNASGKFDATTVSLYNRLDLIHAFIRETNTMYEFPALLHHFQDRDGILNGIFLDSELKRKFGSQGDGFTVSLAIYGVKFGVRFKDV
eukprot:scaffold172036_cov62-Attheya_sp.AAC.1